MKYRIVSRGEGEFKQYKAQKLAKTLFGNNKWKNLKEYPPEGYNGFALPQKWLERYEDAEKLIEEDMYYDTMVESQSINFQIEKEYDNET